LPGTVLFGTSRRGYRLEKSRLRDQRAVGYGGFILIDANRNFAVYGAAPFAYSATLDDIERYLDGDELKAKGK